MNILCIADIHFGKINNEEEMYNALKKYFIGYAEKIKPELIVICGDSYDSKVFTNSNANIYMNKFIKDCIGTGSTIIILEGTEAHDRHQINALSHYISDKFFIVNTVTKLNILGLKLLILPEEYVRNENYYSEYLDDKYDYIFGHGMSSHVGFSTKTSDEIVIKPYVWKAKELTKICKHYTVFGHIHTLSDGTCYGLDEDVNHRLRKTQYDVGVDQNGYKPISYWQLCDIFREKQENDYEHSM